MNLRTEKNWRGIKNLLLSEKIIPIALLRICFANRGSTLTVCFLFLRLEVVKVVVLLVLRETFSKYARIRRSFTQKPIFHYFYYFPHSILTGVSCLSFRTAASMRLSISVMLREKPLLFKKLSTYSFFSCPRPVPT